jgi:hypothetical protein
MTTMAAEHKDMTREWILFQRRLYQRTQPCKTFPQIGDSRGHPNPGACGSAIISTSTPPPAHTTAVLPWPVIRAEASSRRNPGGNPWGWYIRVAPDSMSTRKR